MSALFSRERVIGKKLVADSVKHSWKNKMNRDIFDMVNKYGLDFDYTFAVLARPSLLTFILIEDTYNITD